uniref:Transmembrane 9 superfamily member n=1 Tax=Nicotiana tabacum TaxID=4097 RepID=A0A1S3ZX91_TOBAC|nr:PREDICTED: transmembrane 9 superfamily member 1-like [Nicotiana tabacum]
MMRPTVRSLTLFSFLAAFLVVSPALASESDHKYQPDDPVTLWVNKVGPYNNPQETYNYYSLPFCHASGSHKWGGLGEVLGGNELIDSQIDIRFQKNVDKGSICELELDEAKVKQFKDAIENNYWFEFFIDDLPLWGFVGEQHPDRNSDNKHVLYTHKNIHIRYNKDQIIHVNISQEGPKPLEAGRTLDMTYSVKWEPTNISFARRFEVYLDYPFFEHQIHWFSIFNSFMMVIFLTGLVSMILMRTLRNDYAKYAREDDDLESLERDVSEESGWKLVHGDVFRTPRTLVLLSALVGTGAQLALLVLLVILLAIVGMLYVGRGAIVTTFIVCYALTSFISGYVSGAMYSRNGGFLQVYYVYGFMLLVFLILIVVTVCVTIVGTYFLLNAENYHWQWTSFFSAASTAVYVYLYSVYYYYVKTKMSGFFQTSFYFGYTLMFCLGLGILCGAVGFLGSHLFVRRIYRNIKCD